MTVAQSNNVETKQQLEMLQMITGFWVSRAIYAAAKFGIADLLRDGPKTVGELASQAGLMLRRSTASCGRLRSVGIFAEDDDGRFR